MKPKSIEAIIFDAEGVVLNTEKLWDQSQDVLLGRRGLIYYREYLKPKMAGQTLLQGAQLMIDYYGLMEDAEILAQERRELIDELFLCDILFIDGFKEFFDWICTTNLGKGIATAMNRHLMEKVEIQLDLRRLFQNHIYFIEDVGNRSKPEPDVFLYAADRMGVDPDQCLVIEDAPYGIEAAKRAGMQAVGITTTFDFAQLRLADFVGNNYEEIKNFLLSSGIINMKMTN